MHTTFTFKADSPEGKRLKKLFAMLQTAEQRSSGLVIKQRDNSDHAVRLMVDEIRQVLVHQGVLTSGLDKILSNADRRRSPLEMIQAVTQDATAMRGLLMPGQSPEIIQTLVGKMKQDD